MSLEVDIGAVHLEHPVVNGSGTFDAIAARRAFGEAMWERFPFSAFVSKTITVEPRTGNSPPRLTETPAGLINSIGLPNRGLDGFLASDLPQLAGLPVPLVVSVMATSRDAFARLVSAVGPRPEVDAVELNVSCPNVSSGLVVGERPEETLALVEALRPLTDRALIVKLTPNVADPAAVALAAEAGGADAVSLVNTIRATALDPAGKPRVGAGSGGLSGPAIRPIALEQVRRVAEAVSVPVVGMGGIESGAEALDFLAAGAIAIAVGTANFRDSGAAKRILGELESALSSAGIGSPAALRSPIAASTST